MLTMISCFSFVLPSLPPPNPAVVDSTSRQGVSPGVLWRRRRGVATSEFRRDVYRRGLWVIPDSLNDVTGRVRDCSPEWYRANLAQTHRLVPWLNREANALLENARLVTSNVVIDQVRRKSILGLIFGFSLSLSEQDWRHLVRFLFADH